MVDDQQVLFTELEKSLEEQLLEAVNEQLKQKTMTKAEVLKLGRTIVKELRKAESVSLLHVTINKIHRNHPQLDDEIKPLEDMLVSRLLDQLKEKIPVLTANGNLTRLYQLLETK